MSGESPRTCGRFYRRRGDTATEYRLGASTAGVRDQGKAIIAEVAVISEE
jgi:hypothetical protein